MTIEDFWANPLNVNTTTLIGYRGSLPDFPHDIYSYLLSSVRNADLDSTSLIYRWLRSFQLFWEAQYASIETLPLVFSPEHCPEEYLDYLRPIVGITDDLGYIWNACADTTEKRRLIKYFVRFLQFRGSTFGIKEMIEVMTGLPSDILGYFFYRWIISGGLDTEMETAIGEELEPGDPWLLSEADVPVGVRPDVCGYAFMGGSPIPTYWFEITTWAATITEPPMSATLIIRFIPTGDSTFATPIFVPATSKWYAYATDSFMQSSGNFSTSVGNFLLSSEADQYVYDVRCVDDGTLNRAMVEALVRFSRPALEHAYVRYYSLIEKFETMDNWDVTSGSASITNAICDIYNVAADSRIEFNPTYADDWEGVSIEIKANSTWTGATRYIEIQFCIQSAIDYYSLILTPCGLPFFVYELEYQLDRIVGGALVTVVGPTAAPVTTPFDNGVDYVWRVECFKSARPAGDVLIINVYQDENVLFSYVENPIPWATAKGTIAICGPTGEHVYVSKVNVHPLPLESTYPFSKTYSTYIGPGVV